MGDRSQLIHIDVEFTLSTLAANSAAAVTILATTNENGFRVKTLKLAVTYRGATADEGPISWGVHSNLTTAQVTEGIQARPVGMIGPEVRERANRSIYPQGIAIPHHAVDPTGDSTKIWDLRDYPRMIQEGGHLALYVFNHHNSALTTGSAVQMIGVLHGEWLRD